MVVKLVIQSRALYVLHTRHEFRVYDLSCAVLGTSCGGSACCAPLWTSWRTATPGRCSSTCSDLPVPLHLQLRSHLQHHVGRGSSHLLLLRLRRAQPLQSRYAAVLSCLFRVTLHFELYWPVDKHIIIITLTQWPFLSNISYLNISGVQI